MSKVIKETGNKKHKVVKAIVISALALTAVALGGIATFVFGGASGAVLTGSAIVAVASSAVAAAVAGTYRAVVGVSVFHNKKVSLKTLEKIMEADTQATELSTQQKTKLAKKYAKANLKLCKSIGCPICGSYHSISGMHSEKQTQASNQIEYLGILKDIAHSQRKKERYNKKIDKIANKTHIYADTCLKTAPTKWTKSAENFIDGLSIYDRRMEISCFNQPTSARFKAEIANTTVGNDLGYSLILKPNPQKDYPISYARFPGQSNVGRVKTLLLEDFLQQCDTLTPAQRQDIFPLKVNAYKISNGSTARKDIGINQRFDTYADLVAYCRPNSIDLVR